MFWILILIFISTLVYYYIIKPVTIFREIGIPQESILKCLQTNYLSIFNGKTTPEFMLEMFNKFPEYRYHGFYNLNRPVLVLKDLNLIKQMLIKDFEHFNEHKDFVPAEADPVFGRNMFFLRGEQWRKMRTVLTPSFTSSKIKEMFMLMDEYSRGFIKFFLDKDEQLIEIEMKDLSARYCNDIIASTGFGTAVDSFANPENEFFMTGKRITEFKSVSSKIRFLICMGFPTLSKMFKVPFIDTKDAHFFGNLIKDVLKYRRENGVVRPDMIQLLLEAQKEFVKEKAEKHSQSSGNVTVTDDDIISQALVFYFASFDTNSTMMCYMAYELCVNQNIQDKLRLEIQDISAQCGDKLTYDGMMRMKYMDMVLAETLRKWPSQVGAERTCIKPYTIEPALPNEKPVHFYKGLNLFLPIYGIQHNPDNFPDPSNFDPERFNDENKKHMNSIAYMPWGVGSRSCISTRFTLMEGKIMFYYLLKHYQIVPVEKTAIPVQLPKSIFSIMPSDGFWMGLKKIEI